MTERVPTIGAEASGGRVTVTMTILNDAGNAAFGARDVPCQMEPEAAIRFGERLAQLGRAMIAERKAGAR